MTFGVIAWAMFKALAMRARREEEPSCSEAVACSRMKVMGKTAARSIQNHPCRYVFAITTLSVTRSFVAQASSCSVIAPMCSCVSAS